MALERSRDDGVWRDRQNHAEDVAAQAQGTGDSETEEDIKALEKALLDKKKNSPEKGSK